MTLPEKIYLKLYPLLFRFTCKLKLPTHQLNEIKHHILEAYILNNYGSIIAQYKNIPCNEKAPILPDLPIWVMWWQGEDYMPSIVKACYDSIQSHAGKHPVYLLTQQNYKQYISDSPLWENNIIRYLEKDKISLAYFSDLCRTCLIYTHGGIWIDTTVLLNRNLDDIVTGLSFITGSRLNIKDNYFVPKGKWTAYFIGANKGNILFKFIYDILLAHLKKENHSIEYFMIDYAFEMAYKHLPYVKNMIDSIPPMPNRFHELSFIINQEFVPSLLDKICNEVPFFKLSYKSELKEFTLNEKLTFYGYIVQKYKSDNIKVEK